MQVAILEFFELMRVSLLTLNKWVDTSHYVFFVRVTVTGIYRATPMRVNPRQRNVKAVYKTYIDVIHFKKTDKKRLYSKDPDG